MPNDNAITRLLYAILSQKCLKDIDWNKVARDPILAQEITNGHAARMRYSRFKKQMDGTAPVRRQPRKNKVEKNKSPKKIKDRKDSGDDAEEIKFERKPRFEVGENMRKLEATPELTHSFRREESMLASPMVKPEPGMSTLNTTPLPSTPVTSFAHPHSASQSPSSSFAPGSDMGEMDEMAFSFGMSPDMRGSGLFQPLLSDSPQHAYGMAMGGGVVGMNGMAMGMADPFERMWEPRLQHDGEGMSADAGRGETRERVLVKTEPRWEEGYMRT